MKVLFAVLILTVGVHLSSQSHGQQASHQVDDGPPSFMKRLAEEFKIRRQTTYRYQHEQAIFVVFILCVLFTNDLAILFKRHNSGLLPSIYYKMISRPIKDAAQPDDDEGANKNQHPIKTTGQFDEGECAICYASPQVDKSFPPCGHTYCFDCLVRCCTIQKVCPTCQRGISFFDHDEGRKRCEWNQLRWKTVFIALSKKLFWHTIEVLITSTLHSPGLTITYLLKFWIIEQMRKFGLLMD